MEGDRQRCLDADMDGYVAKPVKAVELFEVIDRVMAASENTRHEVMPDGAPSSGSAGPAWYVVSGFRPSRTKDQGPRTQNQGPNGAAPARSAPPSEPT